MTVLNPLVLTLAALVTLAVPARPQEPESGPLLVGDGQRTVPPRVVEAVGALVRTLPPPADSSRLWMLHVDSWYSGDRAAEPYRIHAYLWPQVSTPRLVRGESVLCSADPKENTWFPESPVVDEWVLLQREPSHYAFVAPPDRPFTPSGPFGGSFSVTGEWKDEDVLAVADAMAQTAPEQKIMYLRMVTPGHASVTGRGTGKKSDGYRMPDLEIEFQKDGTGWTKIKSSRWYL